MERKRWVIAMLVGLTALTAVSFSTSLAWYISSTVLYVRDLEVKIKADRDLRVATDRNGEYVSELSTAQLAPVQGSFAPVSTMFESKWKQKSGPKLPQFYEYRGSFVPTSGIYEPDQIESGFYTQTLYLRADDDVYVTLDPDFCFARAQEDVNRARAHALAGLPLYKEFTEDEIFERLNGVANSMRVSFYFIEDDTYFILDPNKEGTTYYAGLLDNMKDGYFDDYMDPNYQKYEVVYGEMNDRSLIRYGERHAEDIPAVGELTSFNAGHHANTYLFDADASAAAGLEFKAEPALGIGDLSDATVIENNPFAVLLHRNTPKAFQLSIYLEGWDHDCVNAVMGASFSVGMQFKILREA